VFEALNHWHGGNTDHHRMEDYFDNPPGTRPTTCAYDLDMVKFLIDDVRLDTKITTEDLAAALEPIQYIDLARAKPGYTDGDTARLVTPRAIWRKLQQEGKKTLSLRDVSSVSAGELSSALIARSFPGFRSSDILRMQICLAIFTGYHQSILTLGS